ncbi:dienelactone hydrolase family protein [Nocardioides litoris]|uniref:dienelactone hydrolase family protein n=1 Tax=Nocardioides litoris TaxID=1926648 RepID=UPI001B8836AA|nr:dienelactone hydrolase family protein [Nocardioides litoris]
MSTLELVTLSAPDVSAEAYVARPDDGGAAGVLFCMDAIGLRPRIAEMCERIASWGYVVLAPNLFYREGSAAALAPTADLREPGAREEFFAEAMPRVGRLTSDQVLPDVAAYLDALRGLEGVADGPVGVTGYCMGARVALRAACAHPDLVAACGGFHGGGLATDEPDSPHLGLGSARAAFVMGHADNDGSMPPEAVATLGAAFAEHGLEASNEVYPGAAHGYSMADTSMHDEAATERHFTELRDLLDRTLRR